MGTRVAEPTYDLFAVAMIIINIAYPARFDKKAEKPMQQLISAIEAKPILSNYRNVLLNALQGKYGNAQEMRKDIVEAIHNRTSYTPPKFEKPIPKQRKIRQTAKKKKSSYTIELLLVASFFLLAYILYLFGQLM